MDVTYSINQHNVEIGNRTGMPVYEVVEHRNENWNITRGMFACRFDAQDYVNNGAWLHPDEFLESTCNAKYLAEVVEDLASQREFAIGNGAKDPMFDTAYRMCAWSYMNALNRKVSELKRRIETKTD